MQSFGWYLSRLRAMSADEIAWRARSAVRDATDRYRIPLKLYPHAPRIQSTALAGAPRLSRVPLGAWRDLDPSDPATAWRAALVDRADRIAAHRLSFFDLEDVHVGDPIDWNREHASDKAAPVTFAPGIDYRDYAVTGDAKVVWEPNRHHHLVVLARAYRATANPAYASAVVAQLESWIDQSPFGFGMNWRSPLELAVRVVNWVWALDLIADSALLTDRFKAKVLASVHLHVWDIARKYSKGSSANNHRIGEACGVLTATSYFPELPNAQRLRDESSKILAEEILAQTYPSGATREQAFGYQLFVLQLFLYAGLATRRSDRDLPAAYWARLEKMCEFAGRLAEGGPPPLYGDSDDGYVLDLGNGVHDIDSVMHVAAALFGRPAFTHAARPSAAETAYWLFGPAGKWTNAAANIANLRLESRAIEDAGLYLLQWGHRGSRDSVSVVFDCGELGYGSLAAHGHADALAIVVRAFGTDLLVDPGTYDYFTYPEWRQYFRSSRAHNTVTIDGEDQSSQLGSFLWGRRAVARCVRWAPRLGGGVVEGEHDGYAALVDPVSCKRTLDLDQASRTLTIIDEIAAKESHDIALWFHLSERCEATQDGREIRIDCGAGTAVLVFDERLDLTMVRGGGSGEGGWVSRGYHRKAAAWTICARTRRAGTATIRTLLRIDPPAKD
jgi:hypothetical protein